MERLPRRLRLGIGLAPAGPAAAHPVGYHEARRVAPGSMAEAAGMEPGDVLVSLDNWPTRSPAELQVALRSAGRAGTVKMCFERAGATFEKSVPAAHAPTEEGVRYDAIERGAVRLRTMVDSPASAGPGRSPAILFVQGLSLSTMDFAYPDLFRGWGEGGFVTMRLEKRGVGDSEGEAPDLGDFLTEVADVRAAVVALSTYDFVDPDAVFVFGHSIGGMIAPALDADELLRGYLIYGASAEPWFDCLEASARRQWALRGLLLHLTEEARVQALREEMTTRAVTDGRSALYHRQLHEADIAGAWSRVRKPVLVVHGEYDWVVGEDEARRIADLARGTFLPLPRLDHLFSAHDSVEASTKSYGKGRFERDLVRETCAWMRSVTRVGSGGG